MPDNLKQVVDFIFNGESAYEVAGKEFPNNGENLNERVNEFYKEKFNNKIINSIIGEIRLDKRSIKIAFITVLIKTKLMLLPQRPMFCKMVNLQI